MGRGRDGSGLLEADITVKLVSSDGGDSLSSFAQLLNAIWVMPRAPKGTVN